MSMRGLRGEVSRLREQLGKITPAGDWYERALRLLKAGGIASPDLEDVAAHVTATDVQLVEAWERAEAAGREQP